MANDEQVATDEARYLTDDRDMSDRHELVILRGGNGDFYVSVVPEGQRSMHGVRLCTSGGASSTKPGLTVAIARAFRAINGNRGEGDRCKECGSELRFCGYTGSPAEMFDCPSCKLVEAEARIDADARRIAELERADTLCRETHVDRQALLDAQGERKVAIERGEVGPARNWSCPWKESL